MLERFTREKQRASKGVSFNLEDEDELTHYGQSLSKFDDFDNVGLGLDDEEEDEGRWDPFWSSLHILITSRPNRWQNCAKESFRWFWR